MPPQSTYDEKPFGREQHALHAVLVTFFILFLISVAATRYDQRQLQGRWVSLHDISACVIRPSGSFKVKGTRFGVLDRGDLLDITIKMPAQQEIPDAVLCFNVTNAAVSVYSGSRLLTFYGDARDAAGHQIGNVYYRIPLPDGAWTENIRIVCRITENNTSCPLLRPVAVSRIDSIRYFFRYNFNSLFFVSMFMVFFVAFLILLFYPVRHTARRQGLWLSLFCMLLSLWSLSESGFLFTILDDVAICANAEYVALFAIPVAFGMFLRAMSTQKRNRRYLTAASVFFLALFLTATVLNFTTRNYHYQALLMLLHVCIVIGLIPVFVRLFRSLHTAGRGQRLTRSMLMITGVVSGLEIARCSLAAQMRGEEILRSASAFGIIILSGTVLVRYLTRLTELYDEEKGQEFLRRMAYVDILTGLSNRACCQEELRKMEQEHISVYSILFFDVNKLKFANDNFGHEMGDRLLRYVAASLQSAFWGQRVCGRWGGDEFVVCLTGDGAAQKGTLLAQFWAEIQRANDYRAFPFEVSVACGSADSTAQSPLAWDLAVKTADRRMYDRKRAMHFAR